MNRRVKKIAIIGAIGFDRSNNDVRVECWAWDRISRIGNLADYDILIISMPPQETAATIDWQTFRKIVNHDVVYELLQSHGTIVVIGDPRLQIQLPTPGSGFLGKGGVATIPFLDWSGLKFHWDDNSGDTVEISTNYRHNFIREYLGALKRWTYSFAHCELDIEKLRSKLNMEALRDRRMSLTADTTIYCRNRAGKALAFSARLLLKSSHEEFEMGSIYFLPETENSADESVQVVLRDICDVPGNLPEPEWVRDIKAPGQDAVDSELESLTTELNAVMEKYEAASAKKIATRSCLRLLYDQGESLEDEVRKVLGALGGKVEPPTERGKEDGWLTVQIDGKDEYGVLEIKGTKREQFGEEGLRQLAEWIDRGTRLRGVRCKGVFVGNSDLQTPLGKRPDPFSDSWRKSAALNGHVALRCDHLFAIYALVSLGKLTPEQFWTALFSTSGVFDPNRELDSALSANRSTEDS